MSPYYLRSDDEAYQEIINNIKETQQQHKMSFVDAVDYVIEKNKDLILTSIDAAVKGDCGDDNSFTLWCALAAVGHKDIKKDVTGYRIQCAIVTIVVDRV